MRLRAAAASKLAKRTAQACNTTVAVIRCLAAMHASKCLDLLIGITAEFDRASAAEPRSQPVGDSLFHYTSGAGLHGIVNEQLLRATNVRYMNDAMELTDGREVLNRILEGEVDNRELPQGLWLFWQLLRAHFLERPAQDCFATCFCEQDDLLNQWRAYGPEGGFSLGFQSQSLVETIAGPRCDLVKVVATQSWKRGNV